MIAEDLRGSDERSGDLRSAGVWWTRQCWLVADPTVRLEHRREHLDDTRALTRRQIDSLRRRDDVGLRGKALWGLPQESAGRGTVILGLDVSGLRPASKQALGRCPGGAVTRVFRQARAAQHEPRLLAGRATGPEFVARSAAEVAACFVAATDPARRRT